MARLELEYRQFSLYFVIILIFFYFTGYIWVFLYLLVWALAPLEELDPDEVEDEEELWPFIENTYIETNWKKGNSNIKLEFNKLNYNNKEFNELLFYETKLFENKTNMHEINLPSNLFILNNINGLQSIFI